MLERTCSACLANIVLAQSTVVDLLTAVTQNENAALITERIASRIAWWDVVHLLILMAFLTDSLILKVIFLAAEHFRRLPVGQVNLDSVQGLLLVLLDCERLDL